MRLSTSWNRRSFLGTAGAIGASILAPARLFAVQGRTQVSGLGSTGNPYEELGVNTVINCQGTMTMLGGSVMRPEFEDVLAQDGRHLILIREVEGAAGTGIIRKL